MTIEIIRPADRTAWLAARRHDVTASQAACLLGVHPYTTAYGLWAIKSGRIEDDEADNPVLRRGRLLEPVAIELLREERPDWDVIYDRSNTYWRDTEARIGATPDAFATRPDVFGFGIVQVKTASDFAYERNWLDQDTGDVNLPLWIAVQAIVEASLAGSAWAAVALMVVGRGLDLKVIDVPINERLMHRLKREVREFWRMVDEGREPPIDWKRDGAMVADVWRDSLPERRDLSDDLQLNVMIGNYLDAKATATSAGKVVDELRPQILHALGAAEVAVTREWDITARTSVREATGPFGQPIKTRVLRIKPRKDNPYAYF